MMFTPLVIIPGFLLAIFFSELALKGTKIQTGLIRVLVVHIAVAGLLLIYFVFTNPRLCIALIIFWSGAFLTWFGVRSHFESSILLRMLFMLRKGKTQEGLLVENYESHYGEAQRNEELYRGGLLESSPAGPLVTRKGKLILRVVRLLR